MDGQTARLMTVQSTLFRPRLASCWHWPDKGQYRTNAASNGSYTVHAPAGVPIKLRVSYGNHDYGYWYGDGFEAETAPSRPTAVRR